MPSCVMSDLSPSWDEETIALLIGKSLVSSSTSNIIASTSSVPSDSVIVEMIVVTTDASTKEESKSSKSNTTQAKVTFASMEEQRRVFEAYDGLTVPMTHGYHYYRFSDATGPSKNEISAETPPLHLQLIALPTKELDRRCNQMISEINCKNSSKDKEKKQQFINDAVHATCCAAGEQPRLPTTLDAYCPSAGLGELPGPYSQRR